MTTRHEPTWHYAICNELFEDLSLAEVVDSVASLGYHGLEIAPYTLAERVSDLASDVRQSIRKQVEARGLCIVGLHWLLANTKGLYLNDPDPAVRKRTLGYLLQEIDLCADLGGGILVFGSPAQRNPRTGFDAGDAWKWTAEAMRSCGERAVQRGVVFCIEALPSYECSFIRSIDEAADLVNYVSHPGFGMMADTKAMSYDDRPVAAQIQQYAPLLHHVHVNDPNLKGPGMGDLDFAPILGALCDAGYGGWLSVEALDRSADIQLIARESIENMRRWVTGEQACGRR